MQESVVVEYVKDYWVDVVQPATNVNACILAARLTSEVLTYFKIEHQVVPVMVSALNDDMYDFHMAGSIGEPKPSAWNVTVGMENKGRTDGTGWDGHLVVITDQYYIDLSAQQFHRPLKDIVVPSPMVFNGEDNRIIEAPGIRMNHFDLPKGHYLWVPEDNHTYKGAVDWRVNYKRYAGEIISDIRTLLTS